MRLGQRPRAVGGGGCRGINPSRRARGPGKISMGEALVKWISEPWWVVVLESRSLALHTPVSGKMSQNNKRNDFNI